MLATKAKSATWLPEKQIPPVWRICLEPIQPAYTKIKSFDSCFVPASRNATFGQKTVKISYRI